MLATIMEKPKITFIKYISVCASNYYANHILCHKSDITRAKFYIRINYLFKQ